MQVVNKTPSKSITLTDEERAEYERIKPLAHYDPATAQNTFSEYVSKLGTWTSRIRKKYKIDDGSSFFFK